APPAATGAPGFPASGFSEAREPPQAVAIFGLFRAPPLVRISEAAPAWRDGRRFLPVWLGRRDHAASAKMPPGSPPSVDPIGNFGPGEWARVLDPAGPLARA